VDDLFVKNHCLLTFRILKP